MTAKVTIPAQMMNAGSAYTGVMIGLLLPAVQKVRSAASTMQSINNMKQMGVAFHSSADALGRLPGAAICDKNGKPLLSWRVAILPYLEQNALYQQFKLAEPWDSPNNKPLIEKMPKIYADPRIPTKPGETVYKVFVGKEALFEWKEGKRFVEVTDGLSNTLMAAEAGDPVIWTKPDDIEFDSTKKLPKLELPGGVKEIAVLMGDGSVRKIDLNRVSEKTLKIVIGIADGQVTPPDWDGGDLPNAEKNFQQQAIPAQRLLPAKPVAPPPPVRKN
jgi:hypothetical protein